MKIEITPLSDFGVDESILAHTPDETLIAHSNLTLKYLNKIIKVKNLESIIENLIKVIDEDNFDLIKEMFINAVYLHDIGKTNPYFQANKMNNPKFDEYKNQSRSANHSSVSTDGYLKFYKEKLSTIKDGKLKRKLNFILYSFSYQISKHHGKLAQFEDFRNEETEISSAFTHLKKLKINSFELYILNKLLFSLLISSDYYATTQYMSGFKSDDFGIINDKDKIINKFENYEIVKNIRDNRNLDGINRVRSELFLEAEESLLKNLDKNIFYLEAPTGSGKTLISLNLAINILKNDKNVNKIFYVFPFNTVVEQTKKVFETIFENELSLEVINSITPLKFKTDEIQENEESNYQKSYMDRLFFHNELILTTHISFFNILFGVTKEDNFPLWQLANSVIILDEIQSYDNNLWSYMTKFFSIYAKYFNMKIVIMSATLPKLDSLISSDNNIFVELIKDKKKYYQNSYFKNRVKIDYSLLDIEIDNYKLQQKLLEESKNYKRVLFEFIKKESAREFYEIIKDDRDFEEFEIYELTGDDNKAFREYVISKTKEDIKIIIVATQVIEAGVDIDMELGFKDISTIDSEEQFMGRINRSCKKLDLNPKVYFFDKDEEKRVYKMDNRIEFNLKNQEFREIIKNKEFDKFYNLVLEKLKKNDKRIESGVLGNFDIFVKDVEKLNYKNIENRMELIKTQNFRLYFPFSLDIKKYNLDEFKDIDKEFLSGDLLDGEKVWQVFQDLNNISNFAKREFLRYKLNSLMQFFTFNIIKYSEKSSLPYYDYEFRGFYYISNYEEFVKDGKFDRVAYQNKSEEQFW